MIIRITRDGAPPATVMRLLKEAYQLAGGEQVKLPEIGEVCTSHYRVEVQDGLVAGYFLGALTLRVMEYEVIKSHLFDELFKAANNRSNLFG